MKFLLSISLLTALLPAETVEKLDAWLSKNSGRPYVWGATGYKSYDCSGVVWRMLADNGVPIKRTTARKFYMMSKPLPKDEEPGFGTLIFFDDLKHVGIVVDKTHFYHAQTSKGTNFSELTPFWRQKVYGYRRLPIPDDGRLGVSAQ